MHGLRGITSLIKRIKQPILKCIFFFWQNGSVPDSWWINKYNKIFNIKIQIKINCNWDIYIPGCNENYKYSIKHLSLLNICWEASLVETWLNNDSPYSV